MPRTGSASFGAWPSVPSALQFQQVVAIAYRHSKRDPVALRVRFCIGKDADHFTLIVDNRPTTCPIGHGVDRQLIYVPDGSISASKRLSQSKLHALPDICDNTFNNGRLWN